jgi:UDP-N-acetylglucosamine 2-epimerase (non-hydrolysing)
MIRAAHERPEGMDEGSVVMSGLDKNRILESVNMVTNQFESGKKPRIVSDYNVDNVSLKVSRIILSYIDYINKIVWKKDSSTRMT